MLKIYNGGFLSDDGDEPTDELLARIQNIARQPDPAKIAFDPADIHIVNESGYEGFCTVWLITGYSYLIRASIEEMVKEVNAAKGVTQYPL